MVGDQIVGLIAVLSRGTLGHASSLITSHVDSSNLCITCIIISCSSLVVLYVRTLGFSIASKRAQDHRIRSPYAKVITVLVGCCRLFWVPRGHGVFDPRGHGAPCTWACTMRTGPRGHGVYRKCPLEPQRLVLEVGYKRALPPHRLGVVHSHYKHHFGPLTTSTKPLSPLSVKGDLWMDLGVILLISSIASPVFTLLLS